MFQRLLKSLFGPPSSLKDSSWTVFNSVQSSSSLEGLSRADQQSVFKEAKELLKSEVLQRAFDSQIKAYERHILEKVEDEDSFRMARAAVLGVEKPRKQLKIWADMLDKPEEDFDKFSIQ